MIETYLKNKILTLDATVVPQPNITIVTYEWKINNLVTLENLSSVTINTNDLNLGDNTISLRVLNSCGSWSEEISTIVNIINEEAIHMEKTVTVVVDEPIESITVVLDYVGTIEVTVTDGVNPIAGANLELDGVSLASTGVSTGVDGKASIPNVPYGTHVVKVVK